MKYGIKAMELASGGRFPHKGMWLASFDANAHDGRGDASFTSRPEKALAFDDRVQALELWRTQSTVRPLREDGKPNRPLTAMTIAVEPLA